MVQGVRHTCVASSAVSCAVCVQYLSSNRNEDGKSFTPQNKMDIHLEERNLSGELDGLFVVILNSGGRVNR
jgi:hypothetical protein